MLSKMERLTAVSAEPLEQVRARIASAQRVVFFTGAGASAESGIPTFRDALTGLWQRFDAERLASAQGFQSDPALVWGWYEWRRMKTMQAQPNAGHRAITAFIREHPEVSVHVVTQNVDDLHERAGTPSVTHLHGSLFSPRCFACGRGANGELTESVIEEREEGRRAEPPRCQHCGGKMRPGVVWFGERLPEAEFKHATYVSQQSDVLIVVGTSGVVEPAASIVRAAHTAGSCVVQIDPNETAYVEVDYSIRGSAATVLPALLL